MSMLHRMAGVVVLAGAFGWALPAGAQSSNLIGDMTVEQLQTLMQSFGYRTDVTTDDAGYEYIDSETGDGIAFWVTFLTCEGETQQQACKDIAISAQFDDQVPTELVNQWNYDQSYGTAVVTDEGLPLVYWTATLDGGVTRDWIRINFELWDSIAVEFADHLRGGQSGQPSGDSTSGPPASTVRKH